MTLQELMEAVKTAMKEKNQEKLEVLRFLVSQVRNREIEKRATGSTDPLTPEEVEQVFQREAKKRREAIALYDQGGRAELKEKEEAELKIIEEYLPKQLGREEIEAVVRGLKEKGAADFNTLMKASMAELKGRADGKLVSEVVKSVAG